MPHVCGDEPPLPQKTESWMNVCPTYVGMNRAALCADRPPTGMPHVCGDEPVDAEKLADVYQYAPRMWG